MDVSKRTEVTNNVRAASNAAEEKKIESGGEFGRFVRTTARTGRCIWYYLFFFFFFGGWLFWLVVSVVVGDGSGGEEVVVEYGAKETTHRTDKKRQVCTA